MTNTYRIVPNYGMHTEGDIPPMEDTEYIDKETHPFSSFAHRPTSTEYPTQNNSKDHPNAENKKPPENERSTNEQLKKDTWYINEIALNMDDVFNTQNTHTISTTINYLLEKKEEFYSKENKTPQDFAEVTKPTPFEGDLYYKEGPPRYAIDNKAISRGGFGKVFKGVDLKNTYVDEQGQEHPLPVAVKIFDPIRLDNSKDVRLDLIFEVEAKTISRLMTAIPEKSKKHYVQVLGYQVLQSGPYRGDPAIVMEYMDPKDTPTLDMYKRKSLGIENNPYIAENFQSLTTKRVGRIITNTAEILDEAASYGLFNRDIKPKNIFLTKDMEVTLADWGSSNWAKDITLLDSGSAEYAAPEVINGEYDLRSEEFSLAVMAYSLLTDKIPYTYDKLAPTIGGAIISREMCVDIANDINNNALNTVQLGNLQSIFTKALAKNPDDRYQTASEFAKELQAILEPPE